MSKTVENNILDWKKYHYFHKNAVKLSQFAVKLFQFAVKLFKFAVKLFQKPHLLWNDGRPKIINLETQSKQTTETLTTKSFTLVDKISITQSMLFNKAEIDKNSAPNPLCPRCILCDQLNLLNDVRLVHFKPLLFLLLFIDWNVNYDS